MTPTQERLGAEAEAARALTSALPKGQRWRPSPTDPEAIEVAVGIPAAGRVDVTALGAWAAGGWEWSEPCRSLRDVRRVRRERPW